MIALIRLNAFIRSMGTYVRYLHPCGAAVKNPDAAEVSILHQNQEFRIEMNELRDINAC